MRKRRLVRLCIGYKTLRTAQIYTMVRCRLRQPSVSGRGLNVSSSPLCNLFQRGHKPSSMSSTVLTLVIYCACRLPSRDAATATWTRSTPHCSTLRADSRPRIDLLICCGDFQVRSGNLRSSSSQIFLEDAAQSMTYIEHAQCVQAVRNLDDLECLACPPKYRELKSFYKYYTGQLEAPIPTLFSEPSYTHAAYAFRHAMSMPCLHKLDGAELSLMLHKLTAASPVMCCTVGGNHEAANHLWELYYGGWVAKNIFYMGHAGVINFGGARIGGLSGIYNGKHYRQVCTPSLLADAARS